MQEQAKVSMTADDRQGRLFCFLTEANRQRFGLPSRVVPRFEVTNECPGLLPLCLACITADKAFYAPDQSIHLLVVNPVGGGQLQTLRLWQNGREHAVYEVRLNPHGCGLLSLPMLPVAAYRVTLPEQPAELACQFRVAEYEHGAVMAPATSPAAPAIPAVFSRLGAVIQGGLLRTTAEAKAVRGLYMTHGAVGASLFVAERVDTRRLRLTATAAATDVQLLAVNPARLRQGLPLAAAVVARQHHATVPQGTVLELDTPAPFSLVLAGALQADAAWEGWAVTLAPTTLVPEILCADTVEPETELALEIRSGGADQAAAVFLLVKDHRQSTTTTPEERLAGNLERWVTQWQEPPTAAHPPPTCGISDLRVREARLTVLSGAGRGRRFALKLKEGAIGSGPDCAISVPDASVAACHVRVTLTPAGFLLADVSNLPGGHGRFHINGEPLQQHLLVNSDVLRVGEVEFLYEDTMAPVDSRGERAGLAKRRGWRDSAIVQYLAPLAARAEPATPLPTGAAAMPAAQAFPLPLRHDVLFAGLLETTAGTLRHSLKLGGEIGQFRIEALVVHGTEWAATSRTVTIARDPMVELQVAAFVAPGDPATGQLRATASSGQMEMVVWRDGEALPLHFGSTVIKGATALSAGSAAAAFELRAGEYRATVRDTVTNRCHEITASCSLPGRIERDCQPLRFLLPGETLELAADPAVRQLQLLPGVAAPLHRLVAAVAGRADGSCEATAARILAGVVQYLSVTGPTDRMQAELGLIAGIERLQSMWLSHRGFKLYPEAPDTPSRTWGPRAAEHLQYLHLVAGTPALSPGLSRALVSGLRMAADALTAYGLEWPPAKITSAREAYLAFRFGRDEELPEPTLAFLETAFRDILQQRDQPTAGAVAWRTETAYLAALLLRAGQQEPDTWQLVNAVCAARREDDLYATLDSVALIALFAELRRLQVLNDHTTPVTVNGREMTLRDALALQATTPLTSITGRAPVTLVQLHRVQPENWPLPGATATGPLLHTQWLVNGKPAPELMAGQSVELEVRLGREYLDGDLLWLCLPPCLARRYGGGPATLFSVDFASGRTVRVPLCVVAPSQAPGGKVGTQHVHLCVRNLFEEERAACSSPVPVVAQPFRPPRHPLLRWLLRCFGQ